MKYVELKVWKEARSLLVSTIYSATKNSIHFFYISNGFINYNKTLSSKKLSTTND